MIEKMLWLKELGVPNKAAEFSEITLFRERDGKRFSGPGSVIRDEAGSLLLKFYSSATIHDGFGIVDVPPGKLVEKEELFVLTAVDMSGRQWRSDGIWPDVNLGSSSDTAVISARLNEISAREPRENMGQCSVWLIFGCEIDFPSNQIESVERKIGDNLVSTSRSHSIAEFSASGLSVRVSSEDKYLALRAGGVWEISNQEKLISKLRSALQFVFATRLFPELVCSTSDSFRTQTINAVDRKSVCSNLKPFHWGNSSERLDAWSLFSDYFRFISESDSKKAEEVMRWTAEVIEAGDVPVEISILVVSVAVEAIAKMLKVDSSVDLDLDKAVESALEAINELDVQEKIKNRLIGAIGGIKHVRPRDSLELLSKRKLVPSVYVNSWVYLRNKSAHAASFKGHELAETLLHLHRVLALFYRLIFMEIGYQGAFTDYGAENWPTTKLKRA